MKCLQFFVYFMLVMIQAVALDEVIVRNLQLSYDVEKLVEELAVVEDAYMPRRQNVDNWLAIPLRNAMGTDTQEGVALINTLKYGKMLPCKDTSFLQQLPYIASILDDIAERFGVEIGLVRLSKVPSLKEILPHSDGTQFSIHKGTVYRLHIPVLTGQDVLFEIAANAYNLEAGNLYYTNVSKRHSVKNNGPTDRVHIVIDVHATEAFKEYILQTPEVSSLQK